MDLVMSIKLYLFIFIAFAHDISALTDSNSFDSENTETGSGNKDQHLINIQDVLRQAKAENGDININELLSQNVNDPIPIEEFNITNSGFLSDIVGHFKNLQLYGLKGFEVDRLSINLANMNMTASFSAPVLSIVGHYVLDGTFTFFPISGEGPFYMNLSNINLRGHSLINTHPKVSMGEIKLDSDVEDIKVHFENLMGGGTWGSISNSLLNQLSELILGELKPSMLNELSSFLRHQFDNVVFQQLPSAFIDQRSTSILDGLLKQVSDLMAQNNIEPLRLPNFKEVYERKLFLVTTRGELDIYNGTLHGLSTLTRKGDVIAVFENNSLVFEADFMFENLTGDYSWKIQALGMHQEGLLEIEVKSIEGFVRIIQDLKAGSKLTLDTFLIKDIRHIWLDLKGLGTWDYIMESIVNIITNGMKMQLADAITTLVKENMQQQIDKLNIIL